MNSKVAAYYAGILDGEGCLSYDNPDLPKFRFVLNMTDPLVVVDLAEMYGVSVSYNSEESRPTHKPYYCVKLFSRNLLNFLVNVRPYLKMKAAQADVILNCDMSSKDARVAAMDELRRLNKKGSDGNTNAENSEGREGEIGYAA